MSQSTTRKCTKASVAGKNAKNGHVCPSESKLSFGTTFRSYVSDCCNQGWEFAHRFSQRMARFLPKNERMSDLLKKKERFTHSLIFGEQPARFAHNRSFPLSDVSESLMVAYFW